jgi:hypothetical protein
MFKSARYAWIILIQFKPAEWFDSVRKSFSDAPCVFSEQLHICSVSIRQKFMQSNLTLQIFKSPLYKHIWIILIQFKPAEW